MLERPTRRMRMHYGFMLLLPVMTGCSSSDRATVTGSVHLQDGSPLVGARVVGTSQSTGKTVYATTNQEGRFTLTAGNADEGIPAGDYEVAIIENIGRGDTDQPVRRKVPRKYSNVATSGLSFSVESSEHKTLDLSLD